jgi:hypothetical protein
VAELPKQELYFGVTVIVPEFALLTTVMEFEVPEPVHPCGKDHSYSVTPETGEME